MTKYEAIMTREHMNPKADGHVGVAEQLRMRYAAKERCNVCWCSRQMMTILSSLSGNGTTTKVLEWKPPNEVLYRDLGKVRSAETEG